VSGKEAGAKSEALLRSIDATHDEMRANWEGELSPSGLPRARAESLGGSASKSRNPGRSEDTEAVHVKGAANAVLVMERATGLKNEQALADDGIESKKRT